MKKKDVKIDGEYLTKVGSNLVRVRVTGEASGAYGTGGSHNGPARFYCERTDNGQRLPKPRTAAALRPVESAEGPAYRVGLKLAASHVATGIYSPDAGQPLRDIIKTRYPRAGDATVSEVVRGYRAAGAK